MQDLDVIKGALSTEKCVRLIDSQNTLVFVVDKKSSKDDVKRAVKELFSVEPLRVNTMIQGGRKKAFVVFKKDVLAKDIATSMGVL
ncbi:50S ribosomal protein L23 [Candidatus Woesearchaeota archaeon]|nr:50S ribosomal protein L23 [Candidatus Woesearchaeota archaeon]